MGGTINTGGIIFSRRLMVSHCMGAAWARLCANCAPLAGLSRRASAPGSIADTGGAGGAQV